MKKIFITGLAIILIFITNTAYAAVPYIINEDYTNLNDIDTGKTTATVDTSKITTLDNGTNDTGSVYIKNTGKPGAIRIKENGDYIVINGKNIETYSFDGSNMVKNPFLSFSIPEDPLGLALVDGQDIAVLTENEVSTYSFNGSEMVKNPFLSITGFSNPVNIDSINSKDILAIDKQGNINAYSFDGTKYISNPFLNITGIQDPLQVTAGYGGYDYAVLCKDKIEYYSFDGTSPVKNPYLSLTGITKPIAIDVREDKMEYAIIEDTSINMYSFDGTKMVKNTYLSVTGLVSPIAVAFKPGESSYAIVDKNNTTGKYDVKYFQFNGTSMVENPALGVQGLDIKAGYESKVLYGKEIEMAKAVKQVMIVPVDKRPANTDITYMISTDGGTSYTDVIPGSIMTVPEGNKFVYKADLITDGSDTPEIYKLGILDYTIRIYNFYITDIVKPPVEQALPTNVFPVFIKAGYNFSFTIDVDGDPGAVSATFYDGVTGNNLGDISLNKIDEDTWDGTFHTQPDLKNTSIDVEFKAWRDGYVETARYDAFAIIQGSAYDDIVVQRTN